eukprot:15440964-Alexandrium_andersonii.AAC.1
MPVRERAWYRPRLEAERGPLAARHPRPRWAMWQGANPESAKDGPRAMPGQGLDAPNFDAGSPEELGAAATAG